MSRVLNDLPRRFHNALHSALGPDRYALWVEQTRLVCLDEECFSFQVASSSARDKMERLLAGPVTEVARQVTNRNIRLRLDVEPAAFPPPPPAPALRRTPPVFSGFVPGPGNRMALTAARAFALGGPLAPRLLLLCARSGLGRSHLLGAIHQSLGGPRSPGALLFSGEQFRRYAEESDRRGRLDAFLHKCRGASVFMLDDLHLLARRETAGLALAEVLGAIRDRGARAALSSDRHPRAIEGLPRLLRARLRADVEASIDRPDAATSEGVLRRAAPPGTPPAVLAAIARDVASSHSDQLECLSRILARPPVTEASARAGVADFLSEWSFGLTYEDIVRAAAELFGVRATEIYAQDRSRGPAEARQACFYLARKLLGRPFAQIGGHFGGRDHSTVHEACRKLARARGVTRERLRQLEERLRS